MNKPLSSLAITFACGVSTLGYSVAAQTAPSKTPSTSSRSTYGPYRYTDGWNPVPQNQNPRPGTNPSPDQSAVVQSAFYQQAGSGMNLPAYPGTDANAQANNLPLPLPGGLPNNLPQSMPNALPGGIGNAQPSGLSDVQVTNNMPPQNYPGNNYPGNSYTGNNQQVSPPPQQQQQQQFDGYAREQQVLPPTQMESPYRTVSTDLRATQNDGEQYPAQQQNPGNDLRPIKPTMQRGFGPNAQQMDVATGYPFVSPPPRTGNYPTSPYNGSLFRTISYQNPVQPPLSAAVANTQPTLPQNQPVVGVYPTQYQCAPGTATYPAAGAVPGTYVPPTLTPNLTPGTYSPNNSGYSPVFSLGQENYNVQIGRGIIGQPTVYVPGQPFRNFIRYLSP